MFRLALKSVRHNPKRLILTVIAAALGVALVSSTHVMTNAIAAGATSGSGDAYAGLSIIIEPEPAPESEDEDAQQAPDTVGNLFDDDTIADVAAIDGVTDVFGQVYAFGVFLGDDGLPLGEAFASTQLYVNWTGIEAIDGTTLADGVVPSRDNEIAVPQGIADQFGFEIGDNIVVAGPSETFPLTVVGIAAAGDNPFGAWSFVTKDAAVAINGTDDGYESLYVATAESADVDQVIAAIAADLPDGARAITTEQKVEEQIAETVDILRYVDIFSLAFAFISVFVGAYIIINTFLIIVAQRTRELGLLRALGATGRQVRGMVLLESLIIGIVSSIIGIIAGYGMAGLLVGAGRLFGVDAFGTLTLPIDAILWGFGVGIGVTVLSAIMPAIHASRVSPMEALRDAAVQIRKSLKWRNVWGLSFAVAAVAALWIGLEGPGTPPWAWVAGGAVGVVLSVTMLAPQALAPLAGLLRPAFTSTFGVTGKLAANNVRREPRRAATAAAALMIGVMLLSITATFAESIKGLVREEIAGNVRADYLISPAFEPGVVTDEIVTDLESVDGVESAVRIGGMEGLVDGESTSLIVVEKDRAELTYVYPTEPEISQIGDGAYLLDTWAEERGIEVGDSITITGAASELDVEVTGLLTDNSVGGNVVLDWPVAEQVSGGVWLYEVDVVLSDDADVDAMQETLDNFLAENYPLFIALSTGFITQIVNVLVDTILGGISILLSGSLIIAILGIANTLLLSVTERTREIGLLRAVGLKRGSVWGMITLESVVIAIFGTLAGITLGVGLGIAIIRSLADYGFTVIAVPWVWMIVFTVIAMIAGVIAAIWPAWRASRLNVLDAIATE